MNAPVLKGERVQGLSACSRVSKGAQREDRQNGFHVSHEEVLLNLHRATWDEFCKRLFFDRLADQKDCRESLIRSIALHFLNLAPEVQAQPVLECDSMLVAQCPIQFRSATRQANRMRLEGSIAILARRPVPAGGKKDDSPQDGWYCGYLSMHERGTRVVGISLVSDCHGQKFGELSVASAHPRSSSERLRRLGAADIVPAPEWPGPARLYVRGEPAVRGGCRISEIRRRDYLSLVVADR